MSSKFGRIYTLKLETATGETLEVSNPFTCEFQITRHNLASANVANFVIYNLSESNRKKIFKDRYDVSTFRAVQFYAGYETGGEKLLAQCFNGEIRSAYSYRQGPNYKTELECYDGGTSLSNGFISKSVNAGTPQVAIIKMLMDELPNIEGQKIGTSFFEQAKRGIVLFGNPAELLKQYTNGGFYIDSQKAYALDKSEVIPGEIATISSESGLLETPRRAESTLEFSMIFEPRLKISQLVILNSSTAKNFNGTYKVVGVTHRGTISGSVGGECRTQVTLWTTGVFKAVG